MNDVQKKIEEEAVKYSNRERVGSHIDEFYEINKLHSIRLQRAFKDGAKFALDNLAMGEGWVKVEDRLPEERKEVFVWRSDVKSWELATLSNGKFYTYDGLLVEVSHWAKLPTPPEG